VALPPRDHHITLTAAAVLTKRFQDAKAGPEKSGAFHKDQVLKLLAQTGCVALRIHYGRNADGSPALVLTGMDATDSDLTGEILEAHFPCPPLCGDGNTLNS
jgi:hypothetical protein